MANGESKAELKLSELIAAHSEARLSSYIPPLDQETERSKYASWVDPDILPETVPLPTEHVCDAQEELLEAYRLRDQALAAMADLQTKVEDLQIKLEEQNSLGKRQVIATEKLRANVEYWQKRWVIQADWAKEARVAVLKRENSGKGVRFAEGGSTNGAQRSSSSSQKNGKSRQNSINGSGKQPSIKSNGSYHPPPPMSAPAAGPAQTSRSHLADEIPLDPATAFVSYEHSRRFLDFYAAEFNFDPPNVNIQQAGTDWEATLLCGGPSIGYGCSINKECAIMNSYIDSARYLEKCDPDLVESFNAHIAKGPSSLPPPPRLLDSMAIQYALALRFMEYYCLRFDYEAPQISYLALCAHEWEATMNVGGRRLGMGTSHNTSDARIHCFLDVFEYLRNIDPPLWRTFADLDSHERMSSPEASLKRTSSSASAIAVAV